MKVRTQVEVPTTTEPQPQPELGLDLDKARPLDKRFATVRHWGVCPLGQADLPGDILHVGVPCRRCGARR